MVGATVDVPGLSRPVARVPRRSLCEESRKVAVDCTLPGFVVELEDVDFVVDEEEDDDEEDEDEEDVDDDDDFDVDVDVDDELEEVTVGFEVVVVEAESKVKPRGTRN